MNIKGLWVNLTLGIMGKSDNNRKDVEGNGNGLPWKWPEKWMETCLHNIYILIKA